MLLGRILCSCSKSVNGFNIFLSRTIFRRSKILHQAGIVQTLQKQSITTRKTLPFEVDAAKINTDVLIYSHKNERFYKLLTYFGCAQFAFWAYLALFSFQKLKDAPEEPIPAEVSSWWRRIANTESKYKNGISVLCFGFGYLILCISVLYPTRAVKKLWLLKGGNTVQLETYSVLAKYKTLKVPVNSVSCQQSRTDSASQIPMKVKEKWFFFLLDKRGKFHNTELFDFAVGLNRSVN